MKKVIFRLIGLGILAAAGWGGYSFFKQLPTRQELIPTAKVQRSDVVIRAFSRGELRAVRAERHHPGDTVGPRRIACPREEPDH